MAQKTNENRVPHEKTALDFDRDKNLIYRPQDEGYDDEYQAEAGGPSQVPDEDPYKNPLTDEKKNHQDNENVERPDSPRTKAWMQTNEAGVSGRPDESEQFDEQDTDDRDDDTRPRSTVNTVKH